MMIKGIAIVMVIVCTVAASWGQVQTVVYENPFDTLDGLRLFGTPLPTLSSHTPDGTGTSFDNNGDPNHNSGAVVEDFGWDYSQGGSITADLYVTFDPKGCWVAPLVALSADVTPSVSGTQSPASALSFTITLDGDAAWGTPAEERRSLHVSMGFINSDGESSSYSFRDFENVFGDRWLKLEIKIHPDLTVEFFIDGESLWHSTDTISTEYVNNPLWLGMRSSSYGDGLIDNLCVTGTAQSLDAVADPVVAKASDSPCRRVHLPTIDGSVLVSMSIVLGSLIIAIGLRGRKP
jgi:hypothetical protein